MPDSAGDVQNRRFFQCPDDGPVSSTGIAPLALLQTIAPKADKREHDDEKNASDCRLMVAYSIIAHDAVDMNI
jgi:hypothetical protein